MPSNMATNRIITFPRSYMQLYFSGFNNTSYMCVGEPALVRRNVKGAKSTVGG